MNINYYGPRRRSFSSRSLGSLPNRSSLYRASSGGFQPGLYRGSFSALSNSPLSTSTPFLLPSLPALEIDPKLHQIRTEEKEQIKGLNNQFASFIDKVRKLEQQNKVLETQLKLLKGKDQYKSNVGRIMTAHSQPLKQQIDMLNQDKMKLQIELDQTQTFLEELKSQYEEEINHRNQLENEFVVTKKDLDDFYLQKVDVESKLGSITNEIKYLKQLFEEEIKELQSQIQNAMVTVEMDNNRELEMKNIIDEVKEQYKTMIAKSRDETEQWYKNKIDDIERQTQKRNDGMKSIKGQIAELTRYAQHVNGEIEALKNQRASLENAVTSAEEQGEQAVQSAKSTVQDLEEALKQAKHDMATKMREYQELMNLKLALDIEIATYRKLLEGEENRRQHVQMAEESEDSDEGPGPSGSGLLPSEIVGAGSSDEEVPVPSACARRITRRKEQLQQHRRLRSKAARMVAQVPPQQVNAINKLAGLLTQGITLPSHIGAAGISVSNNSSLKRPLMIKTIETKDGKIISEASHFSEK